MVRLGGDEFLVLVTQVSSSDQVQELASRLALDLSSPFSWEDQEIRIEGSVGAVTAPLASANLDELIRRADEAMYLGKRQRGTARASTASQ